MFAAPQKFDGKHKINASFCEVYVGQSKKGFRYDSVSTNFKPTLCGIETSKLILFLSCSSENLKDG